MLDSKMKQIRSIPEMLNLAVKLYMSETALAINKDGIEITESYRDFVTVIRKVADYLESVYGNDRIYAIPGSMSREWLYIYFAILYSGSIAAPVDFLTTENTINNLRKLSPDVVLVNSAAPESMRSLLKEEFPDIPIAGAEEICRKATESEIGSIRGPVGPDRTAMLVFTSGTTGENKIVTITHGNLCADTFLALTYLGPEYPVGTRFFTALPVNHLYALTSCIMCPVMGGHVICIGGGAWKLKNDLRFFRPHLLMVVPMMLTSFFRKLFPDPVLITSEQIGNAKEFFGGRLRLLYSGGAPLGRDYYDIMTLLGIFLVNGYGITECSPIVSYDSEQYHREGSVGKIGLLPEICSVKLIDGEICVKGEIVSPGYYREPELNSIVYDDGWFHTGDLGRIDDDGYLFITGRKKNILILPDGNNISLDELEKQVAGCPSIEAAIVLGKEVMNNPVLAAVVVTKKETGLSGEELEKQIEEEIEEINRKNPRFKRISMVRLLNTDFERTALGKVRKFKYEI